MSYCQYCGYELEAGAVFCWGCGKNDPLPGSTKRAKSTQSGNKAGKLIAIIAGSLVGVVVVAVGVSALVASMNTDTTYEISPDPAPTPTPTDDGGIKKQNGNAANLPGQTLSTPANQR